VSDYYTESIQQQLAVAGLESWPIGRIVENPRTEDSPEDKREEAKGESRWA
jgi:hypothetical protein